LNNIRSLIAIFDATIYKDDFIMLPGDEVVEKKHKNVKFLTAMDNGTDLGLQKTRKFPGLGAPVFKIDFQALFPEAYGDVGEKKDPILPVVSSGASLPDVPKIVENEIATELEVANTAHHKAVVRARNENYTKFKVRFE